MSTRRLFFALWPDEAMRQALAHAARKAVKAAGGRPVPDENLHVTLAFLGSVPEESIATLTAIAQRVATIEDRNPDVVEVRLDGIACWPRSQLLCATSSQNAHRTHLLADTLKRELVAGGFAPDLKPFREHVTLVRKVARVTRELHMPEVVWSFQNFSLIESRTNPEGSIYSCLESWPLCKRQKP